MKLQAATDRQDAAIAKLEAEVERLKERPQHRVRTERDRLRNQVITSEQELLEIGLRHKQEIDKLTGEIERLNKCLPRARRRGDG